MGHYIEVPEYREKALQLKRDHNAQVIDRPEHLADVPAGKTLICVVENGTFDAAAIVYSEDELSAFAYPDGRRRTWLLMDTEEAVKLKPELAAYLRGERSWRY